VLFGGDALAIPYEKFYCKWESGRVFDHQNLGHHITEVVEKYSFLKFDFSHWFELTKNHFIKTNIPIGYGLGSSGAVVAAIFDLFFSIESFKNYFKLFKIFL
jgi:mevalonate kinase